MDDNTIKLLEELRKAKEKHPEFPTDPIHQVAVMLEEAGEAMRAVLQYVYEDGSLDDVKEELAQTGAMCIRVLDNIK